MFATVSNNVCWSKTLVNTCYGNRHCVSTEQLSFDIWFLTYKKQPKNPLHPVWPNNACSFCITATAGTKLVGASSLSTVIFLLNERVLQPNRFYSRLHPYDIAGSRFLSLSNIPHCSLLIKSGPCLSSSAANHSLKLAKHHWLGKLLFLPTT